jgi:hypothetical protein
MAENSAKPARRNGAGKPFAKGRSGNPGGRPKTAGLIREALTAHADEMKDRLLALCRTEYADNAKMAAVVGRALEAYFDRIGVTAMKPAEAPADAASGSSADVAALGDADLDAALSTPESVN